jgi:hypothetical protein
MWVFLNDAFVSIVADESNSETGHDRLLVRARAKADIKVASKHIKGATAIEHTPERDYPWRFFASRVDVSQWLYDCGISIDYPNFKGSIPETTAGYTRHEAYMRVWGVMRRFFQAKQ